MNRRRAGLPLRVDDSRLRRTVRERRTRLRASSSSCPRKWRDATLRVPFSVTANLATRATAGRGRAVADVTARFSDLDRHAELPKVDGPRADPAGPPDNDKEQPPGWARSWRCNPPTPTSAAAPPTPAQRAASTAGRARPDAPQPRALSERYFGAGDDAVRYPTPAGPPPSLLAVERNCEEALDSAGGCWSAPR